MVVVHKVLMNYPVLNLFLLPGCAEPGCNAMGWPQSPPWVARASTGAAKCRFAFSVISAISSSLPSN